MPEITIRIPDGDYCTECPMMEYYNIPLVNMFGDPTGNFREGYRCNRFRCDLEVERAECGWCKRPKKIFLVHDVGRTKNTGRAYGVCGA